ncbi:transposase [Streptomyces sp. NPDC007971]|uniref:transposase n=1 Tax=Streptomyces sp. NPDC007971 TaxID=3364799 RepID=UPI0036E14994
MFRALRGEASFAALCGASPVECSSGSRCHRRLDRGGNRRANAAHVQAPSDRWGHRISLERAG